MFAFAESVNMCRNRLCSCRGHINHRQHHQLTIGRAFGEEVVQSDFSVGEFGVHWNKGWPQAFTKLESAMPRQLVTPDRAESPALLLEGGWLWGLDHRAAECNLAYQRCDRFSEAPTCMCMSPTEAPTTIRHTQNLIQSITQAVTSQQDAGFIFINSNLLHSTLLWLQAKHLLILDALWATEGSNRWKQSSSTTYLSMWNFTHWNWSLSRM